MIVKTNFFNKIQNSVGVDRFKEVFINSCDGKVSLSYKAYYNEGIRGAYVQQLMHSERVE